MKNNRQKQILDIIPIPHARQPVALHGKPQLGSLIISAGNVGVDLLGERDLSVQILLRKIFTSHDQGHNLGHRGGRKCNR